MFKIFKGFDVKLIDFLTMSSTELRGHVFKLYKPHVHLDIREFFYLQKSIAWALLHSSTLLTFKTRLDCLTARI